MGREVVRFCIEGSVSRHNDSRDEVDDEQWDLITGRIRALLSEYAGIVENLRIEESW